MPREVSTGNAVDSTPRPVARRTQQASNAPACRGRAHGTTSAHVVPMTRWVWVAAVIGLTASAVGCGPPAKAATKRGCSGAPRVLENLGAETDPVRLRIERRCVGGNHLRIYAARIDPKRARIRVRPGAEPSPLMDLTPAVDDSATHVVINGGFYDSSGPMGLVVTGARTTSTLRSTGGSGVFLVRGGVPGILHRDAVDLTSLPDEALQSIDRLVSRGHVLVSASASRAKDARSAVAIDARGHVHFVVAFDERAVVEADDHRLRLGPGSSSTGLTLREMAELLAAPPADGGVAAVSALNLDGGASSAFEARIGDVHRAIIGATGTINALVATAR